MRHAGHKWQGAQGVQLHPAVILAAPAKAPQAGPPDAWTRKARTAFNPFAQVLNRYQLALGHAMQVAELGEDGMDAPRLQVSLNGLVIIHDKLTF